MILLLVNKVYFRDFPSVPAVKNPPSRAGDAGLISRGNQDPTCCGATKSIL